jgi:hypothetical protein
MQYEEKRAFMRIDVNCEMRYRLIDSDEFHSAICTSLSGSGVSFISTQPCEEGLAAEISITPQNPLTSTLTAFVEILRITQSESGDYEIAAAIKSIKG